MRMETNKKLIIGLIVVLAVLILSQSLYFAQVYLQKKSNHERVIQLINEDLLFSWDTMDEELQYINKWTDGGHFTNEDLGRLYERASLIYMQKGETLSYYRYLGYALYYLERSTEKDYTINVYLDLANFFLNNYSEDTAYKMMESASKIKNFDDINSLQIKSYAFRMEGICAIYKNDFNKAEEYLEKAGQVVALSNTGIFEKGYNAINDVWMARVYYETGRYKECEELLAKWKGDELFTTEVYRQIMLRDLIVPYIQVKLLLYTAEASKYDVSPDTETKRRKESEASEAYEEFITVCEENGYEKTELNTLLKLQKEYPPSAEKSKELMMTQLQRLYSELFDEQNRVYADVINGTVIESINQMERMESAKRDFVSREKIEVLSIIVVFCLLVMMAMMILDGRMDGLTKLLTRREFNRTLSKITKGSSRYGVIMIDIDFFKQVNDTYGHQNGDMVLERMGQLIQMEVSADVHGYRYGGEEFIIILERQAVSDAWTIADKLRLEMEAQKWPFEDKLVITVSIGIATGNRDVNVLKRADDNLYMSKKKGRNTITL